MTLTRFIMVISTDITTRVRRKHSPFKVPSLLSRTGPTKRTVETVLSGGGISKVMKRVKRH